MDDIRISLDTSGDPGSVAIVRVDGVVDTMTSGELESVMNSLIEQKRYNIVVDLGGVDYISSAGWGIFISNIREIRQNRGDIKLAQMTPSVYEIFELLEFDSILSAFDSVEKARMDFRGAMEPSAATDAIAVMQAPVEAIPTFGVTTTETQVVERKKKVDWNLDSALRDICIHDPFLSTSEIRRALAEPEYDVHVGWWRTWSGLRSMGLGSKKKRFSLSRQGAR
jgi:anti-sigma B factor antagonist